MKSLLEHCAANLAPKVPVDIQYKVPVLGYKSVGTGEFTDLSARSLRFVGKVSVMGLEQELDSSIALVSDTAPGAGECSLSVARDVYDDGLYVTVDGTLKVTYAEGKQTYSIRAEVDYTFITMNAIAVRLSRS